MINVYHEDDVVPELVSEHAAHDFDHRPKSRRHSVVLLLEGQHENVDGLDLVAEKRNVRNKINRSRKVSAS